MRAGNFDYELIEDYLEGRLSRESALLFEEQLRSNPMLATAVEEHKNLLKELRFYGRRKLLKGKLEGFHSELTQPATAENPSAFKNIRLSFRKYLPMMGVAASVALISVFSTLFTIDYMKDVEKSQQSRYRFLKREVDNLKKSQKALSDGLTTPAAAPASELKYGGTGFVLSSDGYVLTNYHLVSKADSVIIESATDKTRRYRVTVVYGDPANDLAILKVSNSDFKGFGSLPYTFRRKPSELGEAIFTLAYPREDIVYGEGSISSRSGFEGDTNAYQVSIPVNPGNSGGPVFDAKGDVIGMISGKQTESEGVAFALKSERILNVLREVPVDSIQKTIRVPYTSRLGGYKRTEQLRKLQDFVFNVKVY
jgi:serine protease Do